MVWTILMASMLVIGWNLTQTDTQTTLKPRHQLSVDIA